MECFVHLIEKSIEMNMWNPLLISKLGPKLLHLFFGNDLLLFCKADIVQAEHVNEVINTFCRYSRQKIKRRKSKIFFSHNTSEEVAGVITG